MRDTVGGHSVPVEETGKDQRFSVFRIALGIAEIIVIGLKVGRF